jgi:hypothetical protein
MKCKNVIFQRAFACFGHYWPSSENKVNTTKETVYMYDKHKSSKGISTLEIKIDLN